MGYCKLPARRDYWVQRQPNSCPLAHWMDSLFSCYKFDYVWRNISLDSLLTDEEVDKTIDADNNSHFEPETEVEEFVVNTVEEDEDNNNDDAVNDNNNNNDDDDDESKKNEEQNNYYDDKEPAAEEEDDNEMSNNNNDDKVDDETINKHDDDNQVEQKKWYYKTKFMMDQVNKISRRHCVHPGFAISIDKIMKLFKGCLNMTHRMKKKPIKEEFKFYAMVCALSGYCFFLSWWSQRKEKEGHS